MKRPGIVAHPGLGVGLWPPGFALRHRREGALAVFVGLGTLRGFGQ